MSRSGKWKEFLKKLNNPPNWIATLAFATTLIACPLALATMMTDYAHTVYAIIAYIICFIIFVYTVYVAVISVRKLYLKLGIVADKFTFTRNLHKNYEFRSIFFGSCSLIFNIGYTVFLCIMAIWLDSNWYGALALYHILLVLTRGGILLQNSKEEHRYKDDFYALQKAKVGIYNYCGYMMLALAAALGVSVVQLVADSSVSYMPDWAVCALAAIALWRVIMAIINFVRSTKHDDLVVRAVRYTNLVTALVSVLTLQTALLGAAKLGFDPRVVNAVTGGVVCAITVALGTFMLIFSVHAKKRLVAQEARALQTLADSGGYNRDGYREEYGEESGFGRVELSAAEEVGEDTESKRRVRFDKNSRRKE